MGKKKPKLDLHSPSTDLQNPFASLSISGLPEGPAEPLPTTTSRVFAAATAPPPVRSRGELILRRETAHRGGKTVVVVTGLDRLAQPDEIHEIATALKKSCGCGGTIKDGCIEIQGEVAPKVAEFLTARHFRVRGDIR